MKKFILFVMIIIYVSPMSFAGEVKDYPVNQARVQEIKQARLKIEQLKKEGKLIYFANKHKEDEENIYAIDDPDFQVFVKTGRPENMASGIAVLHFYTIFAVLLIVYFLFVKKIRLF